ncbi:MAG: putative selenate reductase subunit YgfK, partial [Spirochaetales bacterium]
MKTDIMVPVPFEKLLRHITDEYAHEKSIFGIKKLYKNQKNTESERFSIFNENPELPFGPAAGPHTQLAQNIVAAYVCGSRFFELKTVQILDGEDLPVSKPCIIAHDEAYNCEWSTELYVPQALEEYIKAWILLHILAIEFDLGRTDGFVFNMSVGYDLKGIQSEKIDSFIENLKNAAGTPVFEECKKITLQAVESGHLKKFGKNDIANIRENICAGITLSTLHGCPSDEIERIATYLLTQKKLHTFIKCNPTLLGYDFARSALDKLGFDYITFDEHHFKADLQFDDAIPMFKRLQTLADSLNLSFGIKLTNTFAVDVTANELPSEEMYMSGRSLAPLSLNVAKKVSQAMNGMLRISYSGGADFYNIVDIYNCGIWPITLATTLLKPGGYERLAQIAEQFENVPHKDFTGIDIVATEKLADLCTEGNGCSINAIGMYKKSVKPIASRKLPKKVPLFNCFTASCGETCPIHQDIPTYIRLNGEKNYREALKVIIDKNPLPFITGTICSHPCMNSCTRSFYEGSVHIRSEKLKAATAAYDEILKEVRQSAHAKNDENIHIAIIGAGPAGLSAAYFASRANIKATVFEKRKTAGGIIRHIIPGFRIQDDAIEKDIDFIKACGADIITDTEITSVQDLFDKGFTHVILALGAWHK